MNWVFQLDCDPVFLFEFDYRAPWVRARTEPRVALSVHCMLASTCIMYSLLIRELEVLAEFLLSWPESLKSGVLSCASTMPW